MLLPEAEGHARRFLALPDFLNLAGRVDVAGGIRRKKPDPHDIEIVAIPKRRMLRFGDKSANPIYNWATEMKLRGFLKDRLDKNGRKAFGEKFMRLLFCVEGYEIPLDLFCCERGNWGLTFALRTGPADWNHLLVTSVRHGGAMPRDITMRDGWLWRLEVNLMQRLDTFEEADFFRLLGVPLIPPEERTLARLRQLIHTRASNSP